MMAWTPNWTRLTSAAELALDRTLTCGQSFTWTRLPTGIWFNTLRLPGHAVPVLLRTHNDEVQFRSFGSPRSQAQFPQPVPKTPLPPTQYLVAPSRDPAAVVAPSLDPVYLLLHDYFQLSYSLPALYLDWSTRDPSHFAHVSPLVPGIRLLRQPPVETLFAFICSANNNIARITGMVQALAMRYGECVYPGGLLDIGGGEEQALPPMYVFPTMDRLVQNADEIEGVLRGLGFGYRAKYIAATVKTLGGLGGEAWLVGLRGKGYAEVRDALVQLQGVGRKVADCVALMSLDQPGAIPVDTHVWQIATRDYKFKPSTKSKSLTPTTYDEVVKLFQTLFGPEAGWAHSVLFTADLARKSGNPKSKSKAAAIEAGSAAPANLPGESAAISERATAPAAPSKRKRKASAAAAAAVSLIEASAPKVTLVSADVSLDNVVTGKRRRRQLG